jgi:deoxyribonucleoside regulator
LYNFYDASGTVVDHPVNHRVVSISLEQLRNVPLRVIASGGHEKVESILGAIKLVNCNVLMTNEATARELLLRRS